MANGTRCMGTPTLEQDEAMTASRMWEAFTRNFEALRPIQCYHARLQLIGPRGAYRSDQSRAPEDLLLDAQDAARLTLEHLWNAFWKPEGHVLFVRRPLQLKWYLEGWSPTPLWWASVRAFSVPAAEAKWVQDEIAERVARRVANGGPA